MKDLILRSKYDIMPTTDCLLGEIEMQNLQKKYPILYLILHRLHFITLLKFLAPCLKWHRTIAVLGCFYLKKCDCRKMQTGDFLKTKIGKKKKSIKTHFDHFITYWKDLFSNENFQMIRNIEPRLRNLTEFKETEPIEKLLILDESSSLYLTIKTLVDVQNSILDEVLDITCSKRCTATSFCGKYISNKYIATFPVVPVMDMSDIEIIPDFFPDYAMIYAQRSNRLQCSKVVFDFGKIEAEAAVHFFLRAKYIQFEKQKVMITFKDDIAQSSVARLKHIHGFYPRIDANDHRLENVLLKLRLNSSEANHNLLTVLGIIIATLPSPPMDPDKFLSQYLTEHKSDFSLLSSEIDTPTDARMKDIVDIYEKLEEINGEYFLETHPRNFNEDPPDFVVFKFNRSKEDQWKKIHRGIKVFAHRSLLNSEAVELEAELRSYMQDETFWPISVTDEERKHLQEMMPSAILVKHICKVYDRIKTNIEIPESFDNEKQSRGPNSGKILAMNLTRTSLCRT
ncbi:uncharacterized protein LOC134283573 [Saccostrea cucullata]|uniref:uncharacterized protein LOC134283573 n=1 Tax=Saccostrea cuccullata TaxID=36930 RepID=UPI002ED4C921